MQLRVRSTTSRVVRQASVAAASLRALGAAIAVVSIAAGVAACSDASSGSAGGVVASVDGGNAYLPDAGGYGDDDDNDSDGGAGGDDDDPGRDCDTDSDCPDGAICRVAEGACVAGAPCDIDANCTCDDVSCPVEYCPSDGAGCWCAPSAAGGEGVCRRRSPLCGACTTDAECEPDAACTRLFSGERACLARCDGALACPSGTFCNVDQRDDVERYRCYPQGSASCESDGPPGCEGDFDCPEGKVCNALSGLCVNPCGVDRTTGETTGCTVGLECHAGRSCGAPCADDADCVRYGEGLSCDVHGRCERPGCETNADCPIETVCDAASGDCRDGCAADADCRSGRRCDDATHACVVLTCEERGGAELACDLKEYCCGENERIDCGGASRGACFKAPSPFCAPCGAVGEDPDHCGGMTFGETHWCLPADAEQTVLYCGIGCRDDADCPRGATCGFTVDEGGTERTVRNCVWRLCPDHRPE